MVNLSQSKCFGGITAGLLNKARLPRVIGGMAMLAIFTVSAAFSQTVTGNSSASAYRPVGELSLMVGHTLGAHWAFSAGPLLTIYQETIALPNDYLTGASAGVLNREANVSAFVALQYRL